MCELARRFPPDEVVVHTSRDPHGDRFDVGPPLPVVRDCARASAVWSRDRFCERLRALPSRTVAP
ncbi:hypothetical protein [Actinoallomurus vinaceus]|uniref:hypothetical protein n=1 Tax=Actinoallomurus vinaceus TaxID=1080074 RepID=UPI0031E8E8E3